LTFCLAIYWQQPLYLPVFMVSALSYQAGSNFHYQAKCSNIALQQLIN